MPGNLSVDQTGVPSFRRACCDDAFHYLTVGAYSKAADPAIDRTSTGLADGRAQARIQSRELKATTFYSEKPTDRPNYHMSGGPVMLPALACCVLLRSS